MLHPLNPPNCGRELGFIIGLQRKTLLFSSAFSTYSDSDYARYVGVEFVAWMNSRKNTGLDQDKFVRKFFHDIPSLLRCGSTDKNLALLDFLHDQSFYRYLDDPSFQFLFITSKTPAHEIASKLLVYFFEFLGFAGYPTSVMTHVLGGVKGFCKQDVVQGFKTKNPNIEFVCPSCDNAFTDSGNGNAEGYTLEHYFPKSHYPSICLHPYNMVPMCSKCNEVKGDNDPLAPRDKANNPHPVPYQELFHPIQRHVLSQAELIFSKTGGDERMGFVSKNPSRPYLSSINAYELLYDIPPRWKVIWYRVDKRINDTIKNALKVHCAGSQFDENVFNEVLKTAINDLSEQCGSEYLSYPACRWLEWAKINNFHALYASFNN